MGRDDGDLSATEQIRHTQAWASGTGHLLTLWTAAIRQTLHPGIDEQITARLTESEARRYQCEPSRPALHQKLRAAQLAGHDIRALIDQITAAPMDGAQSIASVLHSRLQRLPLFRLAGHDLTWAQRTPANAPTVAHELAAALDDRARVLGGQLTASPDPWLACHLGVLAPGASPALREEYARRAAASAAYREAAGITDPQQAVSPSPHRGSPELENMRQATIRALEIRDEAAIIRSLTRGDLEARILAADRVQATAPPDVSRQLRLAIQAEADTWQQAADAVTRHDHPQAVGARMLASQISVQRQRLEVANTRYDEWSATTTNIRETARRARAELERCGVARQPAERQPEPWGESQSTAGWSQQFEADITAVDTALDRERQAAITAGNQWPLQPDQAPQASLAVDPQPEGRAARLYQLLGRVTDAAVRLVGDRADRKGRAEYAARIEREAQAEPVPVRHIQISDQAEIEM